MTELRLVCIDEHNIETWYEVEKKGAREAFIRAVKVAPKTGDEANITRRDKTE